MIALRLTGPAWAALLALAAASPTASAAQGEAQTLSASFREASRRVLPAVVTVRAVDAAPRPSGPAPFVQVGPPPRSAGGSGLVVDAARGLVLTNDHIVEPPGAARGPISRREDHDGPPLVVILSNGRERPVKEVRRDPRSDLALLTIDPQGLRQAEWGDSEALDTGDWVLAIGQPFGLSDTVTAGIVSGKGRGLGLGQYEDLIQTDAAINPGNSGGPLVNLKGEVVGINAAIRSLNGGYDGVGFAVPSARARRVAADLAEFGRVRRSYLGLRIGRLGPDDADRVGRPGSVPIVSAVEGGPGAAAGLRPGDVIVAVAGKPVGGTGAFQSLIEGSPAGEPLALTVWAEGQEREVSVRPAPLPDSGPAPSPPPAPTPGRIESTPSGPAPGGEPALEPIPPGPPG